MIHSHELHSCQVCFRLSDVLLLDANECVTGVNLWQHDPIVLTLKKVIREQACPLILLFPDKHTLSLILGCDKLFFPRTEDFIMCLSPKVRQQYETHDLYTRSTVGFLVKFPEDFKARVDNLIHSST